MLTENTRNDVERTAVPDRTPMRERLRFAAHLAVTIFGAALGTAALCQIAPAVGVFGWMASLVSLVRLLAAGPAARGPIVLRMALACGFVFAGSLLVILSLVYVGNPAAFGRAELISLPILTIVAAACLVGCLRLRGA